MNKKLLIIVVSSFVSIFGASTTMLAEYQNSTHTEDVTMTARGEFEIQLVPQSDEDFEMGRLTIEKAFSGDLVGKSKGQMLSVRTATEGSAGYVALEFVTGTLAGRTGTFYFQHSGTMNRGAAEAAITVVPDSGTDELVGLTGEMVINNIDGQHSYEFTYSFASP